MTNKIKNLVVAVALLIGVATPALVSGSVYAQGIGGNLCDGINLGEGGNCDQSASTDGVQTLAKNVINLLSWVVGVISVIMVIVAGFKYITSGGASDKVTGAKNTLVYAVIGLVIVALAQFIVRFVLSEANSLA
ncbi:TrbC/VirB2 family protein [Candidatus Saccharibacteria bacterium]|nr:TrbC/VirB2 family protein [Candidatus Saccharibacteria bacterium]